MPVTFPSYGPPEAGWSSGMPTLSRFMQGVAARLRNALSDGSLGAREFVTSLNRKPVENAEELVRKDRELVTGVRGVYSPQENRFVEGDQVLFDPRQACYKPMVDRWGNTIGVCYPSNDEDLALVKLFSKSELFLPDFGYYRNSIDSKGWNKGNQIPAPWQRLDPGNKNSALNLTSPLFVDVHASPKGFTFLVDMGSEYCYVGVDHENFAKILTVNRHLKEALEANRREIAAGRHLRTGGGRYGPSRLVFTSCGPAGNGPRMPLVLRDKVSEELGDDFEVFMSPHDVNIGTADDDTVAYIEVDDLTSECDDVEESWLYVPAKRDGSRQPKYID